jgi:hypothetical protein
VGKNIYYTTLDNWYLTKYVNIDSTDFDLITANIKKLLTELHTWRHKNISIMKREEDFQTPCGLIFFTYDKNIADTLFTNGYSTTQEENLLKDGSDNTVNNDDLSDDTVNINMVMNGKAPLSNNESDETEVNFPDSHIPGSETELDKVSLQVEVQDHLPDELFDDLEEIGLSTVEGEVKPRDEEEPLPEDLFQDLAESAKATIESGTESEHEEETLPEELFYDLAECVKSTVETGVEPDDGEKTVSADLFHDLPESVKARVETKAKIENEEIK